ncbi:MAG: type II secretion system F family protein [Planctomycetota bacterium]|nr:type II secretion system F family protein [Planctomycetota bacterium]
MSTTTLFAQLNPILTSSVAIFITVTLVMWILLERISGGDRPQAEIRLDRLRKKQHRKDLSELADENTNTKQTLTQVLEKATSPLAETVSGNEKEMSQLKEKLMNAGFRRESAPVVFKSIQFAGVVAGLVAGGVFGMIADGMNQGMAMKTAIGMILGFMVPNLFLEQLVKARKQKIFLGLPDALDLMVVCVEAGLGMDQALRKVAEEMAKSHPEIGEEFSIANQQLQFARPRAEVLKALGLRSGVEDLKQLASILIQADKFGSSVAAALRVQSDAMRVKRRQIAEEKAAKTAVQMIFPLVLFIFPGIFVVLVGPAAINMYRNMLQ